MNDFLYLIGRSSLQAGILAGIVWLVLSLLGRWIAPRWRCIIWWVVAVRLLLPFSPVSHFSVFNSFVETGNFPVLSITKDTSIVTQFSAEDPSTIKGPIQNSIDRGGDSNLQVDLLSNQPIHLPESKWFSSTLALIFFWTTGVIFFSFRTVLSTWRQYRAICMLSDIHSV
jgi:bla regulator protein BlaR1